MAIFGICVADAKNRLPELLKAVEACETVTICGRGIPVVTSDPKFSLYKGLSVIW